MDDKAETQRLREEERQFQDMNERLESMKVGYEEMEKKVQSSRQTEENLRKELVALRLENEAEKKRLDEASATTRSTRILLPKPVAPFCDVGC